MEKCSTKLQLKTKQELLQSRLIKINRGIFQGDSLSPLLFCIPLILLNHELNIYNCGYHVYGTVREISHLLYMDDLKLVGRSEEELINDIKTPANDSFTEFLCRDFSTPDFLFGMFQGSYIRKNPNILVWLLCCFPQSLSAGIVP
jgi:hypothetical protein